MQKEKSNNKLKKNNKLKEIKSGERRGSGIRLAKEIVMQKDQRGRGKKNRQGDRRLRNLGLGTNKMEIGERIGKTKINTKYENKQGR